MAAMTGGTQTGRLRLRHGGVRRGRRLVLGAGELVVPVGSHVAVIGLNGAGKTTLLLHAAGTLGARPPCVVELEAADGWRAVDGWTRALAPQQPRLPTWLPVADVIRLYGHDPTAAAAALPGLRLGQLLGTRAGALSVGQAQAVSLALALMSDADIVLLDEPLAPLDFRRRIGAIAALAARPRKGVLLLAAQSAADVLQVCDWLTVLERGRPVYVGPVRALIAAVGGHRAAGASAAALLEDRLLGLLGDE
jgi:ABC-type multidrug transport system ATPase subunit